MSDKGNPSAENMVVGGGAKGSLFSVRRLRSLNRRQRLLAVLVVVAAVAIVGGILFVTNHKSEPAKPQPKHVSYETFMSQQLSQANQALAGAKTNDQKAKAYTDLSNLYANKPDGQEQAVSYARKLVAIQPTAENYSQLAFALDAAGQYQASADAYRKAASILSKSGSVDDGRSGNGYYEDAAKQEEAKL